MKHNDADHCDTRVLEFSSNDPPLGKSLLVTQSIEVWVVVNLVHCCNIFRINYVRYSTVLARRTWAVMRTLGSRFVSLGQSDERRKFPACAILTISRTIVLAA